MPESAPWQLADFLEKLDLWIRLEAPPQEVRERVTAWIFTRMDDPYQGVRREPGFPNLWFGPIPGSEYGAAGVVCCSYWIFEKGRRVQCDSFATLNRPV